MAKFDVVDLDMKKVSEIELSDDVFGLPRTRTSFTRLRRFSRSTGAAARSG
jgi:ribosomal protein L4